MIRGCGPRRNKREVPCPEFTSGTLKKRCLALGAEGGAKGPFIGGKKARLELIAT